MRRFVRGATRLLSLFADPRRAWRAARALPWFCSDWHRYRGRSGERVDFGDIQPMLFDRRARAAQLTPHYFYQDYWAASKVFTAGTSDHVDVGSRVDGFVAHCACFTRVTYIDLRELDVKIPSITCRTGSITSLPFGDRSVPSISSLHVIEHVGLGRYGDAIDPAGTKRAMAELQRVVAPGGNLYLGVPIGVERVCFNAHRVLAPGSVLAAFAELDLIDFAAVGDEGEYQPNANPLDYAASTFACGLFHFRRR